MAPRLLAAMHAFAFSASPPACPSAWDMPIPAVRSVIEEWRRDAPAQPSSDGGARGAMYEQAATDGQLEEEGVVQLLELLDPPASAVFADLGSGRGEALFHIAARREMTRAVGVELLRTRHERACELRQKLEARKLLRTPVSLVHGDLLDMRAHAPPSTRTTPPPGAARPRPLPAPHTSACTPPPLLPPMLPPAIDTVEPDWAVRACEQLRERLYARLRLRPREVRRVRELYDATQHAFSCRHSRRQLRVPEREMDELDHRNGYVADPHREWLELHCSTPTTYEYEITAPPAVHLMACATRVARFCRERCDEALRELAHGAGACSHLSQLLTDEDRIPPPPADAAESERGFVESMLRVYQYSRDFQLRPDDGHHDVGLLTIIPRSTSPGLQIQPEKDARGSWRAEWLDVERWMADDEAILFGGMTLARLTGIPALFHRVDVGGRVRISAPFFQRPSPGILLPATRRHDEETVDVFNAKTRAAYNDELTGAGVVVVAPHHARDYERRLAKELRSLDSVRSRRRGDASSPRLSAAETEARGRADERRERKGPRVDVRRERSGKRWGSPRSGSPAAERRADERRWERVGGREDWRG
ncbi:hypothetical protein AB1Y20_021125 [Prymnesium parvum]|uniref:Fe2OG dioxygenase domain-containing protein n=1 Tax=Prymnesium parvum TaxID=97485 RepID=A0AB34JIQ6_PRYPA